MDIWQALILGLVEGLTEYLPVSSTGHLLIAQRLLGIEASEAANAYAIVIQAGAIAAVLGLYRRRVSQLARGLVGRDHDGQRMALGLIVAFVPAATLGLLAGDTIESYLFGPWPVAAAWAAGGLLLLVIAPRLRGAQGRSLEALTVRAALIVGFAQCAALWPGVSRSLATILGGLAAGLSLVAAVEFSFLLGLITLGAATAYKSLDSGTAMMEAYGATELAVGFIAAWVSAVLAVKWMVAWLSERGLAVFGWWRLAAAGVVVALILTGRLDGGQPERETSMVRPLLETPLVASVDARLRVTLDGLVPLRYAGGAAPEADLPGHVRGASSVRRYHGRLVIVQDDVNVLALHSGPDRTEPVLLPVGPGGVRVFEEARGTKKLKMDLEACTSLPDGRLLALGSGSNEHRQSVVLMDREGRVERRDAAPLYAGLRAQAAFAGSELNLEGALVVKDELLLFQRGNGATRGARVAVNAIGALDVGDLMRWLDAGGPAPTLRRVVPVELGMLSGVRRAVTDAALAADGRVAVLTCAEASEDVIQDGAVVGCRFGYIEGGALRMADVVEPSGRLASLKLEGLEPRPDRPGEFDVVTDLDRPDEPAMLGRLVVEDG